VIKNGVYVLFCSLYKHHIYSLLVQLVNYDVRTTRKIKFIHVIFITYYYCLGMIVL